MSSYRGRTVVVTGAFSGIGRNLAQLLVDLGAEVHALDVRPVDLPLASQHIVDIADPHQVADAVAALPASVDGLFNCAGVPPTERPMRCMAVNFIGLRHLVESLVPRLQRGSAIANVASIGGRGWPGQLDQCLSVTSLAFDDAVAWCEAHPEVVANGYRFSKSCVIVYTMHRALELIDLGIRMNCLSPGNTLTAMTARAREHYGPAWDDGPNPLGRPADPIEQAKALLFLNSTDASYLVGHNLVVDGGVTAGEATGRFVRRMLTSEASGRGRPPEDALLVEGEHQ